MAWLLGMKRRKMRAAQPAAIPLSTRRRQPLQEDPHEPPDAPFPRRQRPPRLDRTRRFGYPHPAPPIPEPTRSLPMPSLPADFHREFTVALLQLPANPSGQDLLPLAIEAIRKAAMLGANVCVLPELFRSPYFCQEMEPRHFDLAEAVPGPTTELLANLARELNVVIIASLFERALPGLHYNTTAVLDADGTYLGKYRKSHIPDDPLYLEKFYFAPGDSDFPVFQTRFAKIGVLICWDQWYPEAARLCALKGAELLVYPTAIGTIPTEPEEEHARQLQAWQIVQRGHAVANGLYVVAVNRVGQEGQIDFWGHSFCAGPQGEMLAEAGATQPETLLVKIQPQHLADVRHIWPFFRDRRIDLFADLTARQIPKGSSK